MPRKWQVLWILCLRIFWRDRQPNRAFCGVSSREAMCVERRQGRWRAAVADNGEGREEGGREVEPREEGGEEQGRALCYVAARREKMTGVRSGRGAE